MILTKLDAVSDHAELQMLVEKLKSLGETVFTISAVTGKNLQPLLQFLAKSVKEQTLNNL